MILNNYWIMKAYVESHNYKQQGNPNDFVNIDIGLKDLNSSTIPMRTGSGGNNYGWNITQQVTLTYSLKSGLSAILGSSTDEPQPDDVNVHASLMSSISDFNCTVNTSGSSEGVRTVVTVSGINVASSDITIAEIGITKQMYYMYNEPKTILFIRHLLDEPKVVASGEGFSLTFEWMEQ